MQRQDRRAREAGLGAAAAPLRGVRRPPRRICQRSQGLGFRGPKPLTLNSCREGRGPCRLGAPQKHCSSNIAGDAAAALAAALGGLERLCVVPPAAPWLALMMMAP